jgi:hypothetical protein
MLQKFLLTMALVGGALPALDQSQQQGTPSLRMRALACLQANRGKIGAACNNNKVLVSHGQ